MLIPPAEHASIALGGIAMAGTKTGDFIELITPFLRRKMSELEQEYGMNSPQWRALMSAPGPPAVAAGERRAWPPARDQPCWCGSGFEYKKCCGGALPAAEPVPSPADPSG